jgi:heme/copper-type cytochrome/quinol oxidase subunit 2
MAWFLHEWDEFPDQSQSSIHSSAESVPIRVSVIALIVMAVTIVMVVDLRRARRAHLEEHEKGNTSPMKDEKRDGNQE